MSIINACNQQYFQYTYKNKIFVALESGSENRNGADDLSNRILSTKQRQNFPSLLVPSAVGSQLLICTWQLPRQEAKCISAPTPIPTAPEPGTKILLRVCSSLPVPCLSCQSHCWLEADFPLERDFPCCNKLRIFCVNIEKVCFVFCCAEHQ